MIGSFPLPLIFTYRHQGVLLALKELLRASGWSSVHYSQDRDEDKDGDFHDFNEMENGPKHCFVQSSIIEAGVARLLDDLELF